MERGGDDESIYRVMDVLTHNCKETTESSKPFLLSPKY